MQGFVKFKTILVKTTLPPGNLWALLEKINESTRKAHRNRARLNDQVEDIRESYETLYEAVASLISSSGHRVKSDSLTNLSIRVSLTENCIDFDVDDVSRLSLERLIQPYQVRIGSKLNGLMVERQLTYMV